MVGEIGGRDPGYFGPGVIGKEKFEEEKAVVDKGGDVFGPGVTGVGLPNQAVNTVGRGVTDQSKGPETPPPPKDPPSLSIAEIEEALDKNSALLDELLAAEEKRPGGARKGALAEFESTEAAREGGPRQEILDRIAALVAPSHPHGLDEG